MRDDEIHSPPPDSIPLYRYGCQPAQLQNAKDWRRLGRRVRPGAEPLATYGYGPKAFRELFGARDTEEIPVFDAQGARSAGYRTARQWNTLGRRIRSTRYPVGRIRAAAVKGGHAMLYALAQTIPCPRLAARVPLALRDAALVAESHVLTADDVAAMAAAGQRGESGRGGRPCLTR